MSRNYIPYEKIQVGDMVRVNVLMKDEDVKDFSAVIGDTHSFHVDDESAAMTVFGKRICHGMHLMSLVSHTIGTKLPGFGAVYISQTIHFFKPVYINEEIVITLKVLEKLSKKKLLMETVIKTPDSQRILEGQATILCYQ